jgi:hypothetical protein
MMLFLVINSSSFPPVIFSLTPKKITESVIFFHLKNKITKTVIIFFVKNKITKKFGGIFDLKILFKTKWYAKGKNSK